MASRNFRPRKLDDSKEMVIVRSRQSIEEESQGMLHLPNLPVKSKKSKEMMDRLNSSTPGLSLVKDYDEMFNFEHLHFSSLGTMTSLEDCYEMSKHDEMWMRKFINKNKVVLADEAFEDAICRLEVVNFKATKRHLMSSDLHSNEALYSMKYLKLTDAIKIVEKMTKLSENKSKRLVLYWRALRRKQRGKPLLKSLQPQTPANDTNPQNTFRSRQSHFLNSKKSKFLLPLEFSETKDKKKALRLGTKYLAAMANLLAQIYNTHIIDTRKMALAVSSSYFSLSLITQCQKEQDKDIKTVINALLNCMDVIDEADKVYSLSYRDCMVRNFFKGDTSRMLLSSKGWYGQSMQDFAIQRYLKIKQRKLEHDVMLRAEHSTYILLTRMYIERLKQLMKSADYNENDRDMVTYIKRKLYDTAYLPVDKSTEGWVQTAVFLRKNQKLRKRAGSSTVFNVRTVHKKAKDADAVIEISGEADMGFWEGVGCKLVESESVGQEDASQAFRETKEKRCMQSSDIFSKQVTTRQATRQRKDDISDRRLFSEASVTRESRAMASEIGLNEKALYFPHDRHIRSALYQLFEDEMGEIEKISERDSLEALSKAQIFTEIINWIACTFDIEDKYELEQALGEEARRFLSKLSQLRNTKHQSTAPYSEIEEIDKDNTNEVMAEDATDKAMIIDKGTEDNQGNVRRVRNYEVYQATQKKAIEMINCAIHRVETGEVHLLEPPKQGFCISDLLVNDVRKNKQAVCGPSSGIWQVDWHYTYFEEICNMKNGKNRKVFVQRDLEKFIEEESMKAEEILEFIYETGLIKTYDKSDDLEENYIYKPVAPKSVIPTMGKSMLEMGRTDTQKKQQQQKQKQQSESDQSTKIKSTDNKISLYEELLAHEEYLDKESQMENDYKMALALQAEEDRKVGRGMRDKNPEKKQAYIETIKEEGDAAKLEKFSPHLHLEKTIDKNSEKKRKNSMSSSAVRRKASARAIARERIKKSHINNKDEEKDKYTKDAIGIDIQKINKSEIPSHIRRQVIKQERENKNYISNVFKLTSVEPLLRVGLDAESNVIMDTMKPDDKADNGKDEQLNEHHKSYLITAPVNNGGVMKTMKIFKNIMRNKEEKENKNSTNSGQSDEAVSFHIKEITESDRVDNMIVLQQQQQLHYSPESEHMVATGEAVVESRKAVMLQELLSDANELDNCDKIKQKNLKGFARENARRLEALRAVDAELPTEPPRSSIFNHEMDYLEISEEGEIKNKGQLRMGRVKRIWHDTRDPITNDPLDEDEKHNIKKKQRGSSTRNINK